MRGQNEDRTGPAPAVVGPGPRPETRRPHLDGARAVAVYLVVAFHAGVGQAAGGFIGVDVFFVLSGYLVTGLLLTELGPHGRVGLGRFYARRARRLLPAAALTLLATAVVYPAVVTPLEASESRDTLWSAAAGVANWAFLARSTDYFASDVGGDPVLHFWSLAVEEQFYLLWPLTLMAVWALCRRTARPRRTLAVVLATATAGGAGWALHLAHVAPERAHFGTDARAYQLLAGAVLALVGATGWERLGAGRRWPGVAAVAGLGGVVALASPRIALGPTSRGLVATVATVALVVGLDAGPGWARRLLGHPAVAALGRVSYGTYLWHWLVVIVLAREVSSGPMARAALTAVVATGLAVLSARLVELPVRTSPRLDRRPGPVLATAIVAQVLLAAILLPGLNERATEGREAPRAEADGGEEAAAPVDWEAAVTDRVEVPYCRAADVSECTLRDGDGPHVVLLGDSHAEALAPALLAVADDLDLRVSVVVRSTCPWVRGVGFLITGLEECFERQDEWFDQTLPALEPDIVVATHRATDDLTSPVTLAYTDNSVTEAGDPDLPGRLAPLVGASLDDLTALGARVLVLEPTPVAVRDATTPLECLSEAPAEECRFEVPEGPTPLEEVEREEGRTRRPDGVAVADIDRLVCPDFPWCDAVVDGDVVFRDDTHLTATRAAALGDDLLALLRAEGWL